MLRVQPQQGPLLLVTALTQQTQSQVILLHITSAYRYNSYIFLTSHSQWRIMDRRLIMRFTVPGASSEKSIFCQSYSFRQQFKFQNDILELHVVLAKKKLHLFEKYMKKP